jgi:hypothetical protein
VQVVHPSCNEENYLLPILRELHLSAQFAVLFLFLFNWNSTSSRILFLFLFIADQGMWDILVSSRGYLDVRMS